jgi:trans-2-enoyl-CoA reductase
LKINGVEMITDRSQSDVVIAKSLIKKGFQNMTESEKEEFLVGLKGAYNYTDVNRVEAAVEYLAEKLSKIPSELKQYAEDLGVYWYNDVFNVQYNADNYIGITAKKWYVGETFSEEERQKYLEKILSVLNSLNVVPDAFPKTMRGLNHKGANVIESSLVNLDVVSTQIKEEKETLIKGTKKSWFFGGDLYGGEV